MMDLERTVDESVETLRSLKALAEAFGKEGDMLVALTTSGNSANVAEALRASRKLGMVSIGLLGRDGGACRGLPTAELIVRSDSTARIQEAHKVLIHALCREVDRALAV